MINQYIKIKKNPRTIYIILLITLIGAIFSGIFFLWFDTAFPSYGSESYFNRYVSKKVVESKKGIYVQPGIVLSDSFNISDFLSKYPSYEIRDESSADLKIQFLNYSSEESELLYRKIFVPIGKFGSFSKSLNEEDVEKINLYEDKIVEYVSINKEIAVNNCLEIKNIVNKQNTRAIVSLECVDSTVSILAINDISIFGTNLENNRLKSFSDKDYSKYILKYEIYISYDDYDNNENALEYIHSFFNEDNHLLRNINSIVMTGVTAMGRGVNRNILSKGTLYPIEKVANVLKDADIAHTSNEVSFVPGCVQEPRTLSFCSVPESIETLTYAGIDVVEITGNHNNDKGWKYNLDTIRVYEDKDITYIGGGKDLTDAYTVKYTYMGEYKIAWFGFNELGPSYAWATDAIPGAAKYSEEKLVELSAEASNNADIAIMVFQWANENNSYPTELQKRTARLAIDNGVDLVVGSQGHGTQKMEFYNGVPIYYALGNFIFDQMFSDKVREGIILRINTVNGKIVNLEMLPYLIEDYCQPNFVYGNRGEKIINGILNW